MEAKIRNKNNPLRPVSRFHMGMFSVRPVSLFHVEIIPIRHVSRFMWEILSVRHVPQFHVGNIISKACFTVPRGKYFP